MYIDYIHAHLIGVILPCHVIPVHVAHEVFEEFNTQIAVSLVPLLVDLVDVVPWTPPTQLKMQSTEIQLRPIPWPSFITNWKSAVGLLRLSQHALLVGFGCYHQLQRTWITTSLFI
jgi:hypothetical protein